MKKLLLVLFIAGTIPSMAQSWAAPGATWYYDYTNYAFPFTQYGYERIQKTGDTIINSRQYDKLQIYRTWFDQQSQQAASYYVPQLEFTRTDSNGIVYYYRDSADYVLYDFNAQPGDTWVLRSEFNMTPCDTGSVVVDSIATTIINGDVLRVLRTSPVSWQGITLHYPRIIERIGSLGNLFPLPMCMTDIPQGYNLRCYSDSTGWMWQNPTWTLSCDYITNVAEPTAEQSVSIVLNMETRELFLDGGLLIPGAAIEIYDAQGKLVQIEAVQTPGSAKFALRENMGGIYFVRVSTSDAFCSRSFYISGN